MTVTTEEKAYTPGTPLIGPGVPGQQGFIAEVLKPRGNLYVIGTGGLSEVTHEYLCVFEDRHTSIMSDGIVAPMITRAERACLPTVSDISERLEKARAAEEENRRAAAIAAEKARRERDAFLEAAEKRIPRGTKAAIIAEYAEDKSDSMTDYHGHSVKRVVILGFSAHTRDLFPELRKYAARFSSTAHLATAPSEAEHREKYSMGAGFYLKTGWRDSTGWSVRKIRVSSAAHLPVAEWLNDLESTKPAIVDSADSSTAKIEKHMHTKRGFDMFIVILNQRVERPEFERLLGHAKALGGWYSKAWGKTPGGFAFKDETAAAAFRNEQCGTARETASDHKHTAAAAPATAEKLCTLAQGMDSDINARFADRLTNTPKRQREVQSARIEGRRLQRTQSALYALAEMHKSGNVPAVLARFTSRKAVYDLMSARIDTSNSGYYDAGTDTGKPYHTTPEAIALWALLDSGKAAEESQREALREKLAAVKFSNIPGYFPTPTPVVRKMLALAKIPMDREVRILEPEAGSASILDAIKTEYPEAITDCFEVNSRLREILELKGYSPKGDDFLAHVHDGIFYDFVLMNPPFEDSQDIKHVMKAYDFLKPGGRLVAVMSPGPFYRVNGLAVPFRQWFERIGAERHEVEAGAFKESGTGVSTVIIVADKE